MVASLYPTHILTLHDRLTRMRLVCPDLLRATGLDDWLPPLDHWVASLPQYQRIADELSQIEQGLRRLQTRHGQPLPADWLIEPCQQLRAQSARLAALL
ncbi:MAG: hypothetical protein JO171_05530 [Paludibacterium sp.]|uniref:hypothetical protein n=1 Tax=Paludibacterium sp. TaxID=1917523 RepID=UPI0025EF6AC0|nr:hypothetical protein [Paludibacterium sp.]MBV8046590.1 hypothetical protein [Paludibacterium sp.]MBV8646021.1 hypothetical protein [Paludibacterium sp.]